LPHAIQLGQRLGEAHALKMGAIAQLPLALRRDSLTQGITHGRAGKGAPGHIDVPIDTDPDILRDLHTAGVPVDPRRALGDAFSAPGDLLRTAPVQAYAIGQLPSQAQHLWP
jgi:hypothetical protein